MGKPELKERFCDFRGSFDAHTQAGCCYWSRITVTFVCTWELPCYWIIKLCSKCFEAGEPEGKDVANSGIFCGQAENSFLLVERGQNRRFGMKELAWFRGCWSGPTTKNLQPVVVVWRATKSRRNRI